MHVPTDSDRALSGDIASWAMDRLADRSATFPPLSAPAQLPEIIESGIGTASAWKLLRDEVLTTALPTDNPRYLAFVAGAPSVAAVLADMALSASAIYAGSALEGGAVVAAERAALRWLADLAGMPAEAHGAFVSGGSIANLSALVAARHRAQAQRDVQPGRILAGAGAHTSVAAAARIMGCQQTTISARTERFDGDALTEALRRLDPADVVAVVAAAGATNDGHVDDLASLSRVCRAHDLWLHVDAAFGGGALMSRRYRHLFDGLSEADSITIDPHKWFFTPFECGAVLYRDPRSAREAHAQSAPYLDPVNAEGWDNPADYAVHLSRRARGLPLWMALVAEGTDAFRDAVEMCLDMADYAASQVQASPVLELVGTPSLSVVLFRREGWTYEQYRDWSERARRSGLGLVTPTRVDGAVVLRLCFVNPLTAKADVDAVLDDVAGDLR